MAITVTKEYRCDVCQKIEVNPGKNLWWNAALIIRPPYEAIGDYAASKITFLVCNDCTQKHGWTPAPKVKGQPDPPITTGEQLVQLIANIATEGKPSCQ